MTKHFPHLYTVPLLFACLSSLALAGTDPPDENVPSTETGGNQWALIPPNAGNIMPIADTFGFSLEASDAARVRTVHDEAIHGAAKVRFEVESSIERTGAKPTSLFRIYGKDVQGNFLEYFVSIPLFETFGEAQRVEQTFFVPISLSEMSCEFAVPANWKIKVKGFEIVPINDDVLFEAYKPNLWESGIKKREPPAIFTSWQYVFSHDYLRDMALKYGHSYERSATFRDLKHARLTAFGNLDDTTLQQLDQHGLPVMTYLYYGMMKRLAEAAGGKQPDDLGYTLNPAIWDAYVETLEAELDRLAKLDIDPGYIFVIDEAMGKFRAFFRPADKRVSPEWAAIDQEVREKYGFGKFGLPESKEAGSPYEWIAYFSWLNDKLAQTYIRLRQVLDRRGSKAVLLGPDEIGFVEPLFYSELAGSADIFLNQALPAESGSRHYRPGYVARAVGSMSGGKPTHVTLHMVKYGGSPSPHKVRDYVSQVIQAGGDGLMPITAEWYDREMLHMKFAAPEKWETLVNSLQLLSDYTVRTPPRDGGDIGILYSLPTTMGDGLAGVRDSEYQTSYSVLGPLVGTWPRFVESRALAKGHTSLDGLKVLLVPKASIEYPEAVAAIEEFVQAGGTLIVTDPQAFSTGPDSKPLAHKLFSDISLKPLEREATRFVAGEGQSLPDLTPSSELFEVLPAGEVSTLALRTPKGTNLISEASVGNGRVIRLGTNPFASEMLPADARWVAWWSELLASLEVEINRDVWKIEMPPSVVVTAQPVEGKVCLTGNHAPKVQNGIYVGANASTNGQYTYSVAPWENDGPTTNHFSMGNLTNRHLASKWLHNRGGRSGSEFQEQDWVERWKAQNLSNGLEITLRLEHPRELTDLKFWFTETLPDHALDILRDGKWEEIASTKGIDSTKSVSEMSYPIGAVSDRVRLRFSPTQGSDIVLSELELWAKPESTKTTEGTRTHDSLRQ